MPTNNSRVDSPTPLPGSARVLGPALASRYAWVTAGEGGAEPVDPDASAGFEPLDREWVHRVPILEVSGDIVP